MSSLTEGKTVDTESVINTYVREIGGAVAAQLEACTRCGLCAEACHFYMTTGKPEYTPIWKVELLKRAYEQRFTPIGQLKSALGLSKPVTDADLVEWTDYQFMACTECHRCSLACPMGINIADLIHLARLGMTEAGLAPPNLQKALKNQLATGNPAGVDQDGYLEKLTQAEKDYGVEFPKDKVGADIMVVFTSNELLKFPSNMAAIAKILNAGGLNWTISTKGREVMNFGLLNGLEDREVEISMRLIEAAKELGVKRLMISECGHAYENLRFRIENLLGNRLPFEIVHITEIYGELLESGKIKVKPGVIDEKITFHDSCKIQRTGGNFDQPRMALNTMAGNNFIEMTPNREATLCCGGGNGIKAIPESRPNVVAAFSLKIDQVNRTGAKKVAMTCTSCRMQFLDGKNQFGLDDWEIIGMAQLIADNLVEE